MQNITNENMQTVTIKKCPHCQTDIPVKAKKCPNCQGDLRNWLTRHPILTILGLLIIIPIIGNQIILAPYTKTSSRNAEQTKTQPPQEDKQELLELLSFNCHEEVGFCITEGQIKNISNKQLKNVIAVVMLYTTTGEFVTSDEAVVEYNPILPGQVVPFRVTTGSCNPAVKKCVVDFKEAWGGTIPTKRK